MDAEYREDEYAAVQRAAFENLVGRLRNRIPRIRSLPGIERKVAELAVEGRDIHEIAQRASISEDAVWRILSTAAGDQPLAVRDEQVRPVEGGGLGADTDPGVTGGYGDTGFGAIGNEPDYPVTEEPSEE